MDTLGFKIMLFVVVTSIVLWVALRSRRSRIVEQTSEKLKELMEANASFSFRTDIQESFRLKHTAKSKQQFDKYNVILLLNYAVLFDENVGKTLDAINENKEKFADYTEKISKIQSKITTEQAKTLHISYDGYISTENRLFSKKKIRPILETSISCSASYTSPKGRNRYEKSHTYTAEDAIKQREVLRQNIAFEMSAERQKQIARAQMSDKLRYSILKRDGFRCKICGRSAEDGVKLHVDHIIPVSKGGKTTPDNLRTLCDQCNLGKSDELE